MTGGRVAYSQGYDTYTSDDYPPDWQARRRKVLQRDGYTCQMCGLRSTRVDDVRFDIDHIVPKSDGGSHALGNLQTLCRSCHATKHPSNGELQRRGKRFEQRNQPALWLRFVWLVLGPFVSSIGPDEETLIGPRGRLLRPRTIPEARALPEESGVTVEVTVTELWDSDSVQQLGRVRDATARFSRPDESPDGQSAQARFVVWSDNDHPRLLADREYRIVGAKTNSFDGEFQLVVDAQTAIQEL